MWQSLIRLIESGVAGPPNKLFMAFFVGGSQKRHHDLYLLEMQNAKKSMAIKKKIALMSRLGVVRANVLQLENPAPESAPSHRIICKVHSTSFGILEFFDAFPCH